MQLRTGEYVANNRRIKHQYHIRLTSLSPTRQCREMESLSSSAESSAAHPAEITGPTSPQLFSSSGGSPVLAATPRYTNGARACVCLPLMGGEEL